MDTSKVTFGEMIAAAAGAVLLISLFLPWYGVEVSGSVLGVNVESASESVNAWEALSLIDLILFLCAIAAIGLALMRALGQSINLGQPTGLVIAGIGALALVLVIFRILSIPGGDADVDFGGVEVDLGRKFGVFLGLLASAGIAFGGWTAMNETSSGLGAGPGPAPGPGPGPGGPGAGSGGPGTGAPAAPGQAPGAPPAGGPPPGQPPPGGPPPAAGA